MFSLFLMYATQLIYRTVLESVVVARVPDGVTELDVCGVPYASQVFRYACSFFEISFLHERYPTEGADVIDAITIDHAFQRTEPIRPLVWLKLRDVHEIYFRVAE